VPPLRFAQVVTAAFDLIRQAAANNSAVGLRLTQTCTRLAPQLNDDEQRRAIFEEVEAVHQTATQMADARRGRDAFEEAYSRDRLAIPAGDLLRASTVGGQRMDIVRPPTPRLA
jgi:uncharacterized membrane protein